MPVSTITVSKGSPSSPSQPSTPASAVFLVGPSLRGPFGEQSYGSAREWEEAHGVPTEDDPEALRLTHAAVAANASEGASDIVFSRVAHLAVDDDWSSRTSAAATVTLPSVDGAPTAARLTAENVGPYVLTAGLELTLNPDGDGDQTVITVPYDGPYDLTGQLATALRVNGVLQGPITLPAEAFTAVDAVDSFLQLAGALNAAFAGVQFSVNEDGDLVMATDYPGSGRTLEHVSGLSPIVFPGAATGSGDFPNFGDVSAAQLEAWVNASFTGVDADDLEGAFSVASDTLGGGSSLVGSGTLAALLGIDDSAAGGASDSVDCLVVTAASEHAAANDDQVRVEASSDGSADGFDIVFVEAGVERRVSSLRRSTVVNRLASDARWRAELTGGSLSDAQGRPANGTYQPLGGLDGLASLDAQDYLGSATARNGLRAFTSRRPGALIAPALYGNAQAARGLADFNAAAGSPWLVFVSPAREQSATQVRTWVSGGSLASRESLYVLWPHLQVEVAGRQQLVPGECLIVGRMAAVTRASGGGIKQAPAGPANGALERATGIEVLSGRTSPETSDDLQRGIAFDAGIVPFFLEDGVIYADSTRALNAAQSFRHMGEQRVASYVADLTRQIQRPWRLKTMDALDVAAVGREVESTLKILTKGRLFASTVPAQAFTTTTFLHQTSEGVELRTELGLATAKPMEFGKIVVAEKLAVAT
jgi:hypothetical protein